MHVAQLQLFALQLPFTDSFAHSLKTRACSDSLVARLVAEDGTVGYGEAIARPYVTGETVDSCWTQIRETLWPLVQATDWPALQTRQDLQALSAQLPSGDGAGAIAHHAAKAAVELALVDCLLRQQGESLARLLPPQRTAVVYSGVIPACSLPKALKIASYYQLFGLTQIKVKTTGQDDRDRLRALRERLGEQVSLRIDGNGAYDLPGAIATCQALAAFNLESAEQLLPRAALADYPRLRAASPLPIAVDESLVTVEDARQLIAAGGCDRFNLRIAKCGGLAQTLQLAELARAHGISLQLGAHVGETAILSAAGRHLAAHLPELTSVEGSYGTLLLREDLSREPLRFGRAGRAPLLTAPGLGCQIDDSVLQRYARATARFCSRDRAVSG